MTLRTRIAAAFSALSVLAVAGSVHAQFSPPTCVPPNCSPEVIQNIAVSGTAQSASINITGSGKMGGTFQTGALAPVLTAATDNLYYGNVGGTSTNGALLLLQFGSADRFRVTLTGQQQLPLGSAAAPSYSFIGDTNNGFYSSAADSMSFVTNGVSRTTISNSGTTINSGVLSLPAGSAAAPSLTFTGDTNTGIYRSAADTINIATNGVSRFQIDSTGAVLIPGSLTVQGVFTASGGVGGDGSALTNLNASNITSGTLNDARLSTNVATYSGGGTFTGVNTFSNAGNSFTGNGAGLTSLNASNISSGTLADGRLSANVALLDRANQTFTGSNNFTGMTTYGSEALVAGAGQNLMYGVLDGTSAGSLLLLQTEAGGVYTDRFRVTAAGAVTAASFTGVGTGLTALNASNLASGTVPSARISGTYANALTFSNRTSFGSATLNVAAGQNLLYGNVDTASAGNLLLLQNESVDRFRVDAAGNVTIAGTITAAGTLTSGGQNVCVQDGTNCPPTVGGSGTADYVTKFTGPDSVGVSQIQDNGANIGLGGAPDASYLARVYGSMYANSLTATSVNTYLVAAGATGVVGQVVGTGSTGVAGSGGSYGVYGSSGGYGVYGYNTAAGGGGAGVYGYGTGTHSGVQGDSQSGWGGSFSSLYVTPGTSYFASSVTLNGGASLGAGSLLTLGSAAADPSGANGAMYYNSTSNGYRCFTNGAWSGCGIGGSGTTNYVPKFTGASTLGNSLIQDNGTGVSIGGTPAGTALTVIGPTSLSNALIATTNAANGVGIYGFGMGATSIGLYGQGQGAGVYGNGAGASGVGLQGTGNYAGVTGTTANVWGYGVLGTVPAGSYAYGVYGITGSSQYTSAGVAGINSGNGMGGYFQSNNATTYALLAYNGGNPTTGYAFQAQGASSFVGNVNVTNVLGVAGLLNSPGNNIFGDAAADTLTIWGTAVTIPNNLNFDANTLYIDATNNRVGINTNAPTAKLDIGGTGVGTGTLINMNGDGMTGTFGSMIYADIWGTNTDWDGYVFQFRDDTDHSTTKTLGWRGIDIKRQPTVNAGTLTIPVNATLLYLEDDCIASGGTCTNQTDIAEMVQYSPTASGTVLNIANGGTGNGLRVTDVGSFLDTTAFVVTGAGNVGIQDESPTYPLDVNGTAQINGDIWMGTDAQVRLYRGSACCGTSRLSVRASGVDNVAEFASYGMYLPKTGTSLYLGQTMYMGYSAALSTTGSGWICLTGGTSGTVAACGSSSIRYKDNVKDLTLGLDAVNKLRAVTYTWKESGKRGFGFIAEEVEKVDPLLVYYNNDGQIEGVHYPYMAALMAKAIQELDVKVEGDLLKVGARLDAHEARIKKLEAEIKALNAKLEELGDR